MVTFLLANPFARWLFLAVVFTCVMLLAFALLGSFGRRSAVRAELKSMAAGSALMALGKPWMRVGFEITGLAILMVAASILTTYVGAEGMPLALACSEWGMAAIGLALITREMMSPKNRIPARKPAGI